MTTLTTLTTEVPDYLKDAVSGIGKGNENVTSKDVPFPRLVLIQEKTSCLKPESDGYIEGAKPGMMYNSLTRELYEEILVCFVTFEMEYIPKQKGKKKSEFIGRFKTRKEAVDAILENGDNSFYVQDTPQHYGLILNGSDTEMIVIAMPASKKGAHKQINAIVREGNRFAYVIRLGTKLDDNDNYTYKVSFEGYPPKDVYKKALDLYETCQKGIKYIDVSDVEKLNPAPQQHDEF